MRPIKPAVIWNRWRCKNLLSIGAFAKALGMSRRGVLYILQGKTNPHWKSLRKFEHLVETHKRARRSF